MDAIQQEGVDRKRPRVGEGVNHAPSTLDRQPASDAVPVLETRARPTVEAIVARGVPERGRVHVDEFRGRRSGRKALRTEGGPGGEEGRELHFERRRRRALASPAGLVRSGRDDDGGKGSHDVAIDFGRKERVPK